MKPYKRNKTHPSKTRPAKEHSVPPLDHPFMRRAQGVQLGLTDLDAAQGWMVRRRAATSNDHATPVAARNRAQRQIAIAAV
jgi:hypothetical protein